MSNKMNKDVAELWVNRVKKENEALKEEIDAEREYNDKLEATTKRFKEMLKRKQETDYSWYMEQVVT